MATNLRHTPGDTLSLPVPNSTASGDPVLVGDLSGIALTDEGDGGNADNWATVQVGVYGPVFDVEVEATIGHIVAGDRLFIDAQGDVSNDPTGKKFGFAIPEPGQTGNLVTSAQTGTIGVLLACDDMPGS